MFILSMMLKSYISILKLQENASSLTAECGTRHERQPVLKLLLACSKTLTLLRCKKFNILVSNFLSNRCQKKYYPTACDHHWFINNIVHVENLFALLKQTQFVQVFVCIVGNSFRACYFYFTTQYCYQIK